jgi:intergrase/recombinase
MKSVQNIMISDNVRNPHNSTLPKTVRTLPNLVRFQNQGNALSSDKIYQDKSNTEYDLGIEFWNDFEEHLVKSYRKSSVRCSVRCRLLYAKKYFTVLKIENAQSILVLPNDKRFQVMKSLAILSKYMGCYDKWKEIKERYQLKWSDDDSIQVFQNLTNQESNYSSMLKWIKKICYQLPSHYTNILIYCTLTGLRPTEAFSSINLIKSDLDKYLDKDKMILEHIRYPEIFIRKTKKAYISIVNESIIQIAKDTKEKSSYNSLRCYFKRRKIPFNFNYCRKIFATYLRNNGIQQEIIDLLQGRLPKSIFIRYYYRPDLVTYTNIQNHLKTLH